MLSDVSIVCSFLLNDDEQMRVPIDREAMMLIVLAL